MAENNVMWPSLLQFFSLIYSLVWVFLIDWQFLNEIECVINFEILPCFIVFLK